MFCKIILINGPSWIKGVERNHSHRKEIEDPNQKCKGGEKLEERTTRGFWSRNWNKKIKN